MGNGILDTIRFLNFQGGGGGVTYFFKQPAITNINEITDKVSESFIVFFSRLLKRVKR